MITTDICKGQTTINAKTVPSFSADESTVVFETYTGKYGNLMTRVIGYVVKMENGSIFAFINQVKATAKGEKIVATTKDGVEWITKTKRAK